MVTDIIFDFFGTLVSYSPSRIHGHFGQTHTFLSGQGYEISYEDFTQAWDAAFKRLDVAAKESLVEFHMRDVAHTFFDDMFYAEVDEAVAQQLIEIYLREWNVGVVYYEGIRPFLQRLSQNYRLSLISNTHYRPLVIAHLAQMEIIDLFATITLSVDNGLRKPHPKIFEDTMQTLSIAPQQALYVGDNFQADYLGAKSVQMKAVLIDPKQKSEMDDAVVHLFDLESKLVDNEL